MIYYSASRHGFYDSNIHGDRIPEDKVEISVDEHMALLQGQTEGKVIVAGPEGRPMLANQPQSTSAEVTTHLPAEAPQPAPEDEGKAE